MKIFTVQPYLCAPNHKRRATWASMRCHGKWKLSSRLLIAATLQVKLIQTAKWNANSRFSSLISPSQCT